MRPIILWAVASAAIALSVASAAPEQKAAVRRVGILLVTRSAQDNDIRQFRQGLQAAGYVEGRDTTLEWRSAGGHYDRIPALASELIGSKPDVIVVEGTAAAQAVKHATSTIPIVMTSVSDPVGAGLVASLAHPGGNVTGVAGTGTVESWGKRLQLLKDVVPKLSRVGVLWNPKVPWQPKAVAHLKAVAPSLEVKLTFVELRTPDQMAAAFSVLKQSSAQALCVFSDPQLIIHRETLLKRIREARLPAIYSDRRWVEDGGLMFYGIDSAHHWHRAAEYVHKILQGMKADSLPVEQPTKFEIALNLRAANAIGLTFPTMVLVQANHIIK